MTWKNRDSEENEIDRILKEEEEEQKKLLVKEEETEGRSTDAILRDI